MQEEQNENTRKMLELEAMRHAATTAGHQGMREQ